MTAVGAASSPASKTPPEADLSVACLLSLSGGFLDAFTYIGHGQVFANAMTGNVVLLGVFTAAGEWRRALNHIPPIIAFLAGVFLAQGFRLSASRGGTRWPPLMTLLLEIGFLVTIAFLPSSFPDIWIVLSISFAAALQNSSFTTVRSWSYNSVMTTGNLRRFAESLFAGTLPRRDSVMLLQARIFAAVCLCFLVGAFLGGLSTRQLHNAALWIPVFILGVTLWRCLRPTKRHE